MSEQPNWMVDQIEVVIAVTIAAIGGITSIVIAAFKVGGKITHLDESTKAGLNLNAAAIEHVSEKVDDLSVTVTEFKRRNHEEHAELQEENRQQRDALIEHGLKIENLDVKCKGFDQSTEQKATTRARRKKT